MVVPLVLTAVLAVAVGVCHRHVSPSVATRVASATLTIVALVAVPTVWLAAVSGLAAVPLAGEWLHSCVEHVTGHHSVSPWLSAAAGLAAGVGIWRAASVLRAHSRLRRVDGGVRFVEHDAPFAFTAPGRGGLIVVSSALDAALEADELAVVLAHERAHVRHRHDRYLLLVQMIAALLPPLTPLVRQVRFSIERWADEDAVADCGDRRLVAQTLGRVALMGAPMGGALAFGGLGVAARVNALLSPPVVPLRGVGRVLVAVLVALTTGSALLQVRHLSGMVLALCWG